MSWQSFLTFLLLFQSGFRLCPYHPQCNAQNVLTSIQSCTTSFFDLPAHLRKRIYVTAGLVVGKAIVLKPHCFRPYETHLSLPDLRLSYNLLQTCSLIYREVNRILLAENDLVVSNDSLEYGLAWLGRLSPQECSYLTSLYVHLHLKEPLYSWKNPKDLPRTLDQDLIQTWKETITHILSNIEPETLQLYLFCHTGRIRKLYKY